MLGAHDGVRVLLSAYSDLCHPLQLSPESLFRVQKYFFHCLILQVA